MVFPTLFTAAWHWWKRQIAFGRFKPVAGNYLNPVDLCLPRARLPSRVSIFRACLVEAMVARVVFISLANPQYQRFKYSISR
jgi:hypothetical protein